jgi:hypothetical protein
MNEVQSIEEIVASGTKDLKVLTDNSIAREWLVKIEAANASQRKLNLFGEMRVALMGDARPEAREVTKKMFG